MKPIYFDDAAAMRTWLAAHHANTAEVLIGFHKAGSGRAGLTYAEALDEALCFGWIDGVRRSVDAERYTIRFTPRRPKSRWSRVNIAKAEALVAQGRMAPAGLEAFEKRDRAPAGYSFEQPAAELPPELEKRFRARRKAWAFFEKQAPSYRRTAIHWVVSAKREETRRRRLEELIDASAAGSRPKGFPAPGGRAR